jgi:hypothetical protein
MLGRQNEEEEEEREERLISRKFSLNKKPAVKTAGFFILNST